MSDNNLEQIINYSKKFNLPNQPVVKRFSVIDENGEIKANENSVLFQKTDIKNEA